MSNIFNCLKRVKQKHMPENIDKDWYDTPGWDTTDAFYGMFLGDPRVPIKKTKLEKLKAWWKNL